MKKITLLFALLITSIGFSQTYDLLESFNGSGLEGAFGGTSAVYATDPTGSDQVIQINSSATGQVWQGVNVVLTNNYRLTSATQLTMQLDVYSTTAITMAPKAQGGLDGSPDSVTSVDHSGSGWETLTFTFDQSLDGKVPANGDYADFALHINWDTSANAFGAADSRMFYIKNLKGLAVVTVPDPAPTSAAPSPTNSDSNILSIYNDTGAFTANSVAWTQDYDFGSNGGSVDLDDTAGTNNALKMNFSNAGYGAGTNAQTDVTNYSHVHFDYYAPTMDAGVNGHEFKFIIIGGGEFNYTLKEAGNGGDGDIAFDQWVSVSVPLSHFVNLGWSIDNFLQYKLGSTSDLNSKIVYFDNIYFYNSATAGVDKDNLLNVSVSPSPAANDLRISAQDIIENVTIYNVLGKRVVNSNINKKEDVIDVSSLNTGIYILKYTINNAVGTIKFIKE
jgi:hypothetical protein